MWIFGCREGLQGFTLLVAHVLSTAAMPREIVVPVITLRISERESAKMRSVEFSLLGLPNKLVTIKQRFEFI